ncbi:hypothetical protein ES703_109627 [subsurface metagenome]
MTISDQQVRTFIVLILIERTLNNRIPQHVRDAWNTEAIRDNHTPHIIDLLSFRSTQQIPDETKFIQFRDNPNFFDFIVFRELWNDMTKFDDTIAERLADAETD